MTQNMHSPSCRCNRRLFCIYILSSLLSSTSCLVFVTSFSHLCKSLPNNENFIRRPLKQNQQSKQILWTCCSWLFFLLALSSLMCNYLLCIKHSRHLCVSLHFSNIRSKFSSSLYRGHPPFSAPLLLPRGGFTVKLMSLSFRIPHLHGPLPRPWEGPQKYSLSYRILYSFS
jgi:hypothetical protein